MTFGLTSGSAPFEEVLVTLFDSATGNAIDDPFMAPIGHGLEAPAGVFGLRFAAPAGYTVTPSETTVTLACGDDKTIALLFAPVDTTPPVLTLPANITSDASAPTGAHVTFIASAVDLVDGSRAVTCIPPSGATFPIGDTTVSCSASDTHGNTATGTFAVHVRPAAEMATMLNSLAAADGMQQSGNLLSKLLQYPANPGSVNKNAACNDLGAFTNQVQAQSGKKIPAAQASELLTQARHLGATLGCP